MCSSDLPPERKPVEITHPGDRIGKTTMSVDLNKVIAIVETDAEDRNTPFKPLDDESRLIAGHLHRGITVRFAGTVASTCPSPAHQVALDLDPQARDCFVMEPPAFQLHRWDGNALVSHTAYVDPFDGPFPFREDGRLID